MMFSASLSRPVSCRERPNFLPAASTFFPARLKASSSRVLRSSELPCFAAKFHHPEDLRETRELDYEPREGAGQPHYRALYLVRNGEVPGETLPPRITSELREFGT